MGSDPKRGQTSGGVSRFSSDRKRRMLPQRIEVAVQAQPALRLFEGAGQGSLQQLDGGIEVAELRVGAGSVVEDEEVVRLDRQCLADPFARPPCFASEASIVAPR